MGHGQLDPGGPSYGTYQLTSQDSRRNPHTGKPEIIDNGGNVARFLASDEGSRWANEINGPPNEGPGTPGFAKRWQEVARREPEAFAAAQQAYIGRTHFQPQVERVQQETSIDVGECSVALQNVVWSTAVHHGPNTDIVSGALQEKAQQVHKPVGQLTDHECIDAIYDKRAERHPHLKERFDQERGFAHKMLDCETHNPQVPLQSLLDDRAEGSVAGDLVAVPLELSEGLKGNPAPSVAAAGVNPGLVSVPQQIVEALTGQAVERGPAGKGNDKGRLGGKGVEGKAAKDHEPDLNPLIGRRGMG